MAKSREPKKTQIDRHKHKNFYSLRLTKEQQDAVAELARVQMRTKKAVIVLALKKAFEEAGMDWPEGMDD